MDFSEISKEQMLDCITDQNAKIIKLKNQLQLQQSRNAGLNKDRIALCSILAILIIIIIVMNFNNAGYTIDPYEGTIYYYNESFWGFKNEYFEIKWVDSGKYYGWFIKTDKGWDQMIFDDNLDIEYDY